MDSDFDLEFRLVSTHKSPPEFLHYHPVSITDWGAIRSDSKGKRRAEADEAVRQGWSNRGAMVGQTWRVSSGD